MLWRNRALKIGPRGVLSCVTYGVRPHILVMPRPDPPSVFSRVMLSFRLLPALLLVSRYALYATLLTSRLVSTSSMQPSMRLGSPMFRFSISTRSFEACSRITKTRDGHTEDMRKTGWPKANRWLLGLPFEDDADGRPSPSNTPCAFLVVGKFRGATYNDSLHGGGNYCGSFCRS